MGAQDKEIGWTQAKDSKIKEMRKIIAEFCEMIEIVGCPQDYGWLYTEACKLINRDEI
jgi:hypothetical protein